jgi:hypothetical protein
MGLERVAALVGEQGSPMTSVTKGKSGREIELRALRVITAGVVLFLIGVLVCVAGKRLFHQDEVTTLGIFLLVFGLIMGVLGIVQGLWSTTKAQPPARLETNTRRGLRTPTAEALPAPTPSVTESTTRIIDTDPSLPSEDDVE